jgi:hypothetical protein
MERLCHVRCEGLLMVQENDRVAEVRASFYVVTTQTKICKNLSVNVMHTVSNKLVITTITRVRFQNAVCIHFATLRLFWSLFFSFPSLIHHMRSLLPPAFYVRADNDATSLASLLKSDTSMLILISKLM